MSVQSSRAKFMPWQLSALFTLRGAAIAFIVFVCLTLIGHESFNLWRDYETEMQRAGQTSANLSRSIAEHADEAFGGTDALLLETKERIESEGPTLATYRAVRRSLLTHSVKIPSLRAISVLDASGRTVVDSQPLPMPRDLSDRDYFRFHRNDPTLHPFIGRAIQTRATGDWVIPISRRINNPDGSFAGLVVAGVDIAVFQSFYDTVDVGPQGIISLVRNDGTLLIRRPSDPANVGRKVLDATQLETLRAVQTYTSEVTSLLDNKVRIVSHQALNNFPLVVAVGLVKTDILAKWQGDALRGILMTLLLTALIATLGWHLAKQIAIAQRAERSAEISAEAYRLLADTSSEMIFTLDMDFTRRYVSPASKELIGYAPEELIGLRGGQMDHPDDNPRVQQTWRRMAEGLDRAVVENRVRHRDGHWVWVETNLRLIRDPETGKPKEIFGTVHDISDRKQAGDALEEARQEAERANQAKSDFLTAMSHELRTPMNGILGFGQLLDGEHFGPLKPKQKEFIGAILDSGHHLLQLINDILELSKIEAGKVKVELEPVDVLTMMKSVVATLGRDAEKYGIDLLPGDYGAGMPAVAADRTRLAQVLINFGTNAIKYNRPDGNVRFTCRRLDEHWVRFTVADTGLGIPEEKQAEIFQPFNRLGAERGPIEGTGIGLSLTRKLIELMGGRIGFESKSGEGSSFWIDMPVHRGEPGSVTAPDASPDIPRRSGFSVLYVEDNPNNLTLMRHIIATMENVRLIEAGDGASGIALAQQHRPEVILVDINLPDMNGFALLQQFKKIPALALTPVLALSASAMPRDIQRGLQAGFFRYLTKPIDLPALMEGLESALQDAEENSRAVLKDGISGLH